MNILQIKNLENRKQCKKKLMNRQDKSITENVMLNFNIQKF